MQESDNLNKSELWTLSLRDLFYKYVRFLPIIIFSVALALFGAYIYLRYATPIYRAGGTLLIKAETQGGRSDKFEDIFVNSKTQNIQSEIEILKSRPLMARVVNKLDLQFSYFAKGKIKNLNIYKYGPFRFNRCDSCRLADTSVSFTLSIKFINENEFRVNNDPLIIRIGQTFKNQYGIFQLARNSKVGIGKEYTVDYKPTPYAAAIIAGSLQVIPKVLSTGILNITMDTPNGQMGVDVIDTLMEEYASYTKEVKNIATDSMLAFIDSRIVVLREELDNVQDSLLDYSQKNDIVDIETQLTGYFDNISNADKAINEQQLQLISVELLSDYLSDKNNAFNRFKVPTSFTLPDATLNELVKSYNDLQLNRQAMLDANVARSSPAVVEIESQIDNLRVSLLENLRKIKDSYSKVIGELQQHSLQSQDQLKALPFKARGYYELKQQVENKKTLYNLLQGKREETAISRASTISNSQVVEKAAFSSAPVKPKRRSIQIMAILVGLAVPALFIFMSEVLNDKVSTRFDIEKITPTPILGEVGHSYIGKTLIVNKTTRSMVAEQFRIIRSNLQYILGKVDKSILLVSSSFSGEGKSFVSINMGAVLALAGKRTIILEFDIRKPKVLTGLNLTKRPGITNYLVGKTDNIEELISPVEDFENLYAMGCGPVPPNPSELLLDPKVEGLFNYLKTRFDAVIVDTAPVGMVSDAMTLGKFADCTLYLVRQGHTFKKQVALIDEFYQANKLPKVSIIINDVKMKPGYGYYGYGRYGYGYGYGYGSYYEEEHPPHSFAERIFNRLNIRRWLRRMGRK